MQDVAFQKVFSFEVLQAVRRCFSFHIEPAIIIHNKVFLLATCGVAHQPPGLNLYNKTPTVRWQCQSLGGTQD